ncbi:MAG TPA: HDIG domain-containing protein [Opitutaceae bacterium]|nr:HDIG domain-containing protein [Opitutaceae bacterium]
MSVRNQLRLLVGGLSHRRDPASSPASSAFREFLEQSRMVAVPIFVLTVAAIVVISSVGVNTLNVPVLPKQIATVQVVASTPFSYTSEEKTQLAREQLLDRVPPVYRLEAGPLKDFEPAVRDLLASLAAFQAAHPNAPPALTFTDRNPALAQLADRFDSGHAPYHVTAEDLAGLLTVTDPALRATLFENGLAALREIYASGVRDDLLLAGEGRDGVAVFQIVRPSGDVSLRPVQSLEDALTFLRVSLAADGVPRPAAQALFRFFRNGVTPNLVFDRDATQRRINEALQGLKPAVVSVARGQTIIQAGERVTAEEYEMFRAYQEYLRNHAGVALGQGLALFGRVLLVLAMVLASLLYIRLEDPETLRSNGRLSLLALVVIINLALVRVVYSLGGAEFFLRDSSWSATLPYVAPTALAPIIVAILIDAGSAIFMALLISIFTGVIYGNRLDLLVLTFLASLVAISGCRDARRRGRVVRAAGAGGLTVAAFAALIGIADQTPTDILVREMAAGLITGLLTGIAVVGFLPVLESLFKRTTDITLLELTDYNHPLLRRMQLEAPGTYHHSLVVAQLSENACNAIGANPLLARVCALFHDIGKTGNSAHFTENQRNRVNPHEGKDPLTSARIIMRHVPEGVDLALKHHLPRAVVDVIRQHHGTTRVRFFYERAAAAAPALSDAPYRYPGPRPQFKESAVISLADGVEAASRTLRSATPEQLGHIIDRVIGERIADQQLAEAPLTFEDVAKVKNSFIFTLLNMLHSRVAYDADKPAEPAAGE